MWRLSGVSVKVEGSSRLASLIVVENGLSSKLLTVDVVVRVGSCRLVTLVVAEDGMSCCRNVNEAAGGSISCNYNVTSLI